MLVDGSGVDSVARGGSRGANVMVYVYDGGNCRKGGAGNGDGGGDSDRMDGDDGGGKGADSYGLGVCDHRDEVMVPWIRWW